MAALCLGAEAIVPFLYSAILAAGKHLKVEDKLAFFKIHIECDDGHALAFRTIINDELNKRPGAIDCCREVAQTLIKLRIDLFEAILDTGVIRCLLQEVPRADRNDMSLKINQG